MHVEHHVNRGSAYFLKMFYRQLAIEIYILRMGHFLVAHEQSFQQQNNAPYWTPSASLDVILNLVTVY